MFMNTEYFQTNPQEVNMKIEKKCESDLSKDL